MLQQRNKYPYYHILVNKCYGIVLHKLQVNILASSSKENFYKHIKGVATLTLGSRPRQGFARLLVKKETRESHNILPGVQRVWGHEPSHSQVNSHVGSWSLEWIPKSLKHNCRGQNSLPWRVFYIIGKLLKRKCLKWARISHLNICNISYGQKKGRESNWQFDSWPLKVRNRPDFLAFRQRATYHWNALNEGYNFALDLIAIRGLQRKLCTAKIAGVPGQKTIWMWPLWRATKYTIRGKVVVSPKSGPWWILCVRVACGSS
jgi:hypothetical protein